MQTLGIIENIAAGDCSKVETCLLKDDFGTVMRNLKKEYSSMTGMVEEIFHLWTDGKGATPISWVGLVVCLRSAKLNRLADEMESAYNLC